MIGRLNHVALAVPDLDRAVATYREILGARVEEPCHLPEFGVTVVFVRLPNTNVELLYPYGENSPIRRFLQRNPAGGMHHVCYEVADIRSAVAQLGQHGLEVL
ncbi:MAG: VOC family protein, partial [Magnetococcales bacterium]|nr:VOC family protein [Magnetococcales bacterium]